jgi:hypothetical protein
VRSNAHRDSYRTSTTTEPPLRQSYWVTIGLSDRRSCVSHLYPKTGSNPHKTTQINPNEPLLIY